MLATTDDDVQRGRQRGDPRSDLARLLRRQRRARANPDEARRVMHDGRLHRSNRCIGPEVHRSHAGRGDHGGGQERRQQIRIVLGCAAESELRIGARLERVPQLRECLQADVRPAVLDEDAALVVPPQLAECVHRVADRPIAELLDRCAGEIARE
jgi:hypothetical protein